MRTAFIVVALLLIKPSWAQQKVSFGKVSMQELQMKFYEKDTAASAVILSDIGVFDSRDLRFTRHVRIKILTKAGLEWGNWVINTPAKSDFVVYVFNLENGEPIKERATNSSIYEEEIVDGFSVYKVFAPHVKVGSIIDIRYSFLGLPFEWRFQERIPVVYSELRVEESNFIRYSKRFFGLEPIETLSDNKWRAQHVRAFNAEPFINTYKNYISKFEFQLISLSVPGTSFYISHSTSWRNIINNLLDFSSFGGILNNTPFLNDIANKIRKNDALSADQKINAAYDYIKSNIKWNKSKALLASRKFKWDFTEDHTGNSAEVNLSLIYLLNKIGVETHPVVLSTRDNGLLQELSPSFDKLNYVVAMVQHENTHMFLDATSENLGPGFLPDYCLNIRGLMVKRDNEQWFTLKGKNAVDMKKQFVNVLFDGINATAKVSQDFSGLAFFNWIHGLDKINFDKELRMGEIVAQHAGLKCNSYDLVKKDIASHVGKESYEIDFSGNVLDAGDELIFSPLFFFDYANNPFKSEERRLPVDLISEKELNTTVIVNVPKGFSLKKVPESIKFSTPDGGASFSFLVGASPTGLQYRIVLKINRAIFSEVEYLELKQFFTQIGKLVNSPIELIKT